MPHRGNAEEHRWGKAEAEGGERGAGIRERGIVIASGLMAGGALGGVFGAALRLVPGFTEDWVKSPFYDNVGVSQTVSALLFVGLCGYVWRGSTKAGHGAREGGIGRAALDGPEDWPCGTEAGGSAQWSRAGRGSTSPGSGRRTPS